MADRKLQNRKSYERLKERRKNKESVLIKADFSMQEWESLRKIKKNRRMKTNAQALRFLLKYYSDNEFHRNQQAARKDYLDPMSKNENLWTLINRFRLKNETGLETLERVFCKLLDLYGDKIQKKSR